MSDKPKLFEEFMNYICLCKMTIQEDHILILDWMLKGTLLFFEVFNILMLLRPSFVRPCMIMLLKLVIKMLY